MIRIVIILLGVVLIGVGYYDYHKASSVHNWAATNAEIIRFDFKAFGEKTVRVKPLIKYTYEVEGKTYFGDKIYINEEPYWEQDDFVNEFAVYARKGSVVRVFYDKSNPNDAVLKRKENYFDSFIYIYVGSAIIIIGILGRLLINGFLLIVSKLPRDRRFGR